MNIAEIAARFELPASLIEHWGIRTTEDILAMILSGLSPDFARALSLARSDQLLAEIRDRLPRDADPILAASEWVNAEAFRIAVAAIEWAERETAREAAESPPFDP